MIVGGEERDPHHVRSGSHRDTDVDGPVVVRRIIRTQSDADIVAYRHGFVVDQKFQLFTGSEFAQSEVGDGELVFPVGRKAVANGHPPAGTKRQTLNVLILRSIAGRDIGGFRRRLPKADRRAGDPRGRRRVGFQQSWGNGQRAGHIVEATGRIVGGQKRVDIDL